MTVELLLAMWLAAFTLALLKTAFEALPTAAA